jgi:hypothetical protein
MKYIKRLYSTYKDLVYYSNFFKEVNATYEEKKKALLNAHRNNIQSDINRLLIEVNILANLLKFKQVESNRIAESIEYYPNRVQ